MRPEVISFLELGPLPREKGAKADQVFGLETALKAIEAPVTREEAVALATAFGPDDCFGLSWTLLHLIESAPGGPPLDSLPAGDNEWIILIRQRSARV